jgi:hypothetical protein
VTDFFFVGWKEEEQRVDKFELKNILRVIKILMLVSFLMTDFGMDEKFFFLAVFFQTFIRQWKFKSL